MAEFVPPSDDLMNAILDSLTDAVVAMDQEWKIISFNDAAERLTGIARAEALGRPCCDVLHASICADGCQFKETLETGRPSLSRAIHVVNARGETIPVSISTALLRDRRGAVIGGVETIRDLTLVEALRKKLTGRYTFQDIVSKNHRMRQLFDTLPTIAQSDSTVLIQGESGTGKELLARALHDLGPRRSHPLVAVNCGALPDTLLESELFGYKAGAFTDARHDKPGRFALAEGGTLFLDEISDISPAMQVRLLRVLQDGVYEPLGATEPRHANVRIICASNRSLPELVAEGKFRKDLFYRIHVVRLELPPLRERLEDIPLLAAHFIGRFNRLQERQIEGLSAEALARLAAHDYPGNVRELENLIEHAFVLCRGAVIQPEHLPRWLGESIAPPAAPDAGPTDGPSVERRAQPRPTVCAGNQLAEAERRALYEVLRENHWNRSAAARALGIHKATLFRKIKALGIALPAIDGRTHDET